LPDATGGGRGERGGGGNNLKSLVMEVGLWQRFQASNLKIPNKGTTSLTTTFIGVIYILFCLF
jgi:hypothetical protein